MQNFSKNSLGLDTASARPLLFREFTNQPSLSAEVMLSVTSMVPAGVVCWQVLQRSGRFWVTGDSGTAAEGDSVA